MVRSIRFRITALATVITAVLVVAFGWWLTELVADDLVRSGESALAELTDDVEGLGLVELGEEGAQFELETEGITASLDLDDDGDIYVELFVSDGPADDVIGAFVLDTGTGTVRQLIAEPGGLSQSELRTVSERVAAEMVDGVGDEGADRLDLVTATQDVLADVSGGVDAARNAAWRVGPILVLLSGFLTWFVVGRALAPTRRIADEAAAITGDRLDRRISRNGATSEVDTIARVINEMLDRIEGGVRREQQFVADASHELKTPLATVRAAAELAGQDAPSSAYPPQLVDEVDRMRELIDDLLELSRGTPSRPSAPVRLDLLVQEAVAEHGAASMVQLDVVGEVVVHGRHAELRRVVLNLVDNATRHADASVTVRIDVLDDETVVLIVDDDGPGIPEADRERVFERFARLDAGRGRADGGSGLGLAIVRAIVERHGGTVGATVAPHGGARLRVTLPTV